MLYSFAFVFDPRVKIRAFHKELTLISQLTSNDYANYYDSVRSELTVVFSKYDLRFGGQNAQRKQVQVAGKKKGKHGGRYMVLK